MFVIFLQRFFMWQKSAKCLNNYLAVTRTMVEITIAIKTKIEINNKIWYFLTLLFFIPIKFSTNHWKFQYSIAKFAKNFIEFFKNLDFLHKLGGFTQYKLWDVALLITFANQICYRKSVITNSISVWINFSHLQISLRAACLWLLII